MNYINKESTPIDQKERRWKTDCCRMMNHSTNNTIHIVAKQHSRDVENLGSC
jgi:hypothetical protein